MLKTVLGLEQARMNRFGDGMKLVVLVSESDKRAGIEEDLQQFYLYR